MQKRVIDGKTFIINDGSYEDRTWRERLFSWPWRPFRKQNFFGPKLGEVWAVSGDVCICSSATFIMMDIESRSRKGIRHE